MSNDRLGRLFSSKPPAFDEVATVHFPSAAVLTRRSDLVGKGHEIFGEAGNYRAALLADQDLGLTIQLPAFLFIELRPGRLDDRVKAGDVNLTGIPLCVRQVAD